MKVIDFKDASCRHCYKCVRNCEVKAISVQNQQARIIEEACIHCGHCLEVCPQNAKTFSSDLERIRGYLKHGVRLAVSVAPSYAGDLPISSPGKVAGALRRLGFSAVRETAEGAAYVTDAYARLLEEGKMENIITTCCPGVNDLIEKYYPSLVPQMAPVVSPMIAHGRLMKKIYGQEVKTVFLGPCIAKKQEAEGDGRVAGAVDAILTFEELMDWLALEGMDPEACEDLTFDNPDPLVNRLYPVGGGILDSVAAQVEQSRYHKVAVDGVENCRQLFADMERGELTGCFLEVNLCEGGCVRGPVSGRERKNFAGPRIRVEERTTAHAPYPVEQLSIPLDKEFMDRSIILGEPPEAEIKKLLRAIGKYHREDELNCGGCGYPTCREKAKAVYYGKAELDMCLPYAITKAESMANVIIDETPDIVFLTDADLQILECSKAALELLEISKKEIRKRCLFEFIDDRHMQQVLEKKENIINKRTYLESLGMTVLETIVLIESPRSLLVMFQDVTMEEAQKERNLKLKLETVEMAQKVIDKQMMVAQEIAGLLGETTAETKVTLSKLRDAILYENEEEAQ
ncbi:MAG: [Fe-Fe] hydrogenase large subunit C-terminal domain-containing protein [Blautia sp.]|jgi:iron only hydrogenase large subunit-like protein/uncharacterized Fe-S cluster-containing protein